MYCLGSYGFSFAKVESNKEHDKDELEWWSPQENNRHQAVVQFFVQQSSICCWSSKPWTVGTVSPWRLKGLTCLWSTSGRRWARQDSSISFPFWDVGRKRLTGAFSVDFACMLKVCAAILFGKDSLKLLCSSFSRVNKSSESSCQKMELPNVSRKHHDLGLMRFPFLSRFFVRLLELLRIAIGLAKAEQKRIFFDFDLHHLWWTIELRMCRASSKFNHFYQKLSQNIFWHGVFLVGNEAVFGVRILRSSIALFWSASKVKCSQPSGASWWQRHGLSL